MTHILAVRFASAPVSISARSCRSSGSAIMSYRQPVGPGPCGPWLGQPASLAFGRVVVLGYVGVKCTPGPMFPMISLRRPTISAPLSIRQPGCGLVKTPPYIEIVSGTSVLGLADCWPVKPGHASMLSLGRGDVSSSAAAAPGIPATVANVANQLQTRRRVLANQRVNYFKPSLTEKLTLRRECSPHTWFRAHPPGEARLRRIRQCAHRPEKRCPCLLSAESCWRLQSTIPGAQRQTYG